jgi:hypothetical protein
LRQLSARGLKPHPSDLRYLNLGLIFLANALFQGGYVYCSPIEDNTFVFKFSNDNSGNPLFTQVAKTIETNALGVGPPTITSYNNEPGTGILWSTVSLHPLDNGGCLMSHIFCNSASSSAQCLKSSNSVHLLKGTIMLINAKLGPYWWSSCLVRGSR